MTTKARVALTIFFCLAYISQINAATFFIGRVHGAGVYFFDDDRAYFGRYFPRGDHSPGDIYISRGMTTHATIQTMAHELCHLKQDMERRAFSEKECCIIARQGNCG